MTCTALPSLLRQVPTMHFFSKATPIYIIDFVHVEVHVELLHKLTGDT